MITIVSQNREHVLKTSHVYLGYKTVYCFSSANGEKGALGEYATEERAKEVFEEIIEIVKHPTHVKYGYEYDRIFMTSEKPKVYEMPKE